MPAGLLPTLPTILFPPPAVTAVVHNGVLRITGTEQADAILVRQTNGQISVSGVPGSISAAAVQRIEVYGLGGNDVIRLDSETIGGGQPILKPALVTGGFGNDMIIGGRGNDILQGNSGDDILIGNSGNDLLDGGAGRDKAYGGVGNDRIVADLQDVYLAGQAGIDSVKFDKVDPSPLVQGNPATMKQVLQLALANQSFSQSHDGQKITVDHLKVDSVAIVDGVTTVTVSARIRYKKTVAGITVVSESGDVKFTFQPQLSATFVEAHLQAASVTLANPHVLSVHLDNVPSWVTNNDFVRDFLTAKLAQVPPISFTAQAQAYLNAGGVLGPTLVA